ncbi:uncharacterized protein Bfra_000559 [Botrytis fragariae]|uniref:Uncharacterized protein n=1 Tax=Botrytis fragariae TaxID=1964551 RepID=A0A8H6B2Y2_9HELO|nr:uncharacterized protein Bfra_000559 [Botrytis fragariae]KAF5878394.1 hypothetical protein Bfra_000559 [Botrytis fragariae]
MNMEMDAPLLRPSTSTSTQTSLTYSSTTSSTHRSFNFNRNRPLSTSNSYTSSHTLSSHTLSPPRSNSPSTLSRTRSLCAKFNTEVQFMKMKLSTRGKKEKGKGKGRWVRVEGEGESERRVEMVWRRLDGGQGSKCSDAMGIVGMRISILPSEMERHSDGSPSFGNHGFPECIQGSRMMDVAIFIIATGEPMSVSLLLASRREICGARTLTVSQMD